MVYNLIGKTGLKLLIGALVGTVVTYGVYRGVQNAKRIINKEGVAKRNSQALADAKQRHMNDLEDTLEEKHLILKEKEQGPAKQLSDTEHQQLVQQIHTLSNGILEKPLVTDIIKVCLGKKTSVEEAALRIYVDTLGYLPVKLNTQQELDDTWKVLMADCTVGGESWYRPTLVELKEGINADIITSKSNKVETVVVTADDIVCGK